MNYEDIINYDFKLKHKRMDKYKRAAQFAPFAALTGYNEQIYETGRIVSKKRILDDNRIQVLNNKLNYIKDKIQEQPLIEITYFLKDLRKDGGSYIKLKDNVKKISNGYLYFNSDKVNIEDIFDIVL